MADLLVAVVVSKASDVGRLDEGVAMMRELPDREAVDEVWLTDDDDRIVEDDGLYEDDRLFEDDRVFEDDRLVEDDELIEDDELTSDDEVLDDVVVDEELFDQVRMTNKQFVNTAQNRYRECSSFHLNLAAQMENTNRSYSVHW